MKKYYSGLALLLAWILYASTAVFANCGSCGSDGGGPAPDPQPPAGGGGSSPEPQGDPGGSYGGGEPYHEPSGGEPMREPIDIDREIPEDLGLDDGRQVDYGGSMDHQPLEFNEEGPSGTAFDPETGESVTVVDNGDGTRDVIKRDAQGNVTGWPRYNNPSGSGHASGEITDPNTGRTTAMGRDTRSGNTQTFEWGPDGNATMTHDAVDLPFNQEPSGSTVNPETGETTTVVGNQDGTRDVTRRDASGNVTGDIRYNNPSGSGHASGQITDPNTGRTTAMGRDTRTGQTERLEWGPDGNATMTTSGPASQQGPSGTMTNPETGETVSVGPSGIPGVSNVTHRDAQGNITSGGQTGGNINTGIGTVSTTDPRTGTTTTVHGSGGQRTTTTTDSEGHTTFTPGSSSGNSRQGPSGTMTNTETGETVSVGPSGIPGVSNVTHRDAQGNITSGGQTGGNINTGIGTVSTTDPRTGTTTTVHGSGGQRTTTTTDSEGRTTVELSDIGRPIDTSIRDTNAGTMHVINTNYLGVPSGTTSSPDTHPVDMSAPRKEE